MEIKKFLNYYEILEVDPYAPPAEIEHKFRTLARRYHPDNQRTGDRSRFDQILEANETLRDSGRRADYHREHQTLLGPPPAFDEDGEGADEAADGGPRHGCAMHAADGLNIGEDLFFQNRILMILYVNRRRNVSDPGIGDAELEQQSGCPPEQLDFNLWYLKEKRWIATGDDGRFAITMEGVDQAAQIYQAEQSNKLLTNQS